VCTSLAGEQVVGAHHPVCLPVSRNLWYSFPQKQLSRKGALCTRVGVSISAATVEISTRLLQKPKIEIPCHPAKPLLALTQRSVSQDTGGTCTPCLSQHCSQQPSYAISLEGHQPMNGQTKCDTQTHTHTPRSSIQP
jgi:hypothetical protein